jgi:hypothetical protein
LHALAMKQRAEVASQILRFVESKRTTLFEASKDDLQTLLDAPGKQFRRPYRLGEKRFAHQSLDPQPVRPPGKRGSSSGASV